ncbi:MAG: ATP-binding protein [Sedimentisphaerales bacterium]|nr:ATP-binding protein [Sedimentisphaerales bacterium]
MLNMKIAIASGKGGTGKTTIATNLACSIARIGQKVQYLDCDVEEPNGHIFLKPDIKETHKATVGVPEVDMQLCEGCGNCGQLCQYSAIICLKDSPMVFEQLCHSCGGCMLVCPTDAITEKQIPIGFVDSGTADGVNFVQGRLNIGDVRTPALIKRVKEKISDDGLAIIDAPPGTSCPVIEAIKGVDFCLLVTEPTPFGLNDLKLAIDMVKELKLPFAVLINRSDSGDDRVQKYCDAENIKVILEIPDDRRIAEAYSSGRMIVDVLPEYRDDFLRLHEDILQGKAGQGV